MDRHQSLALVAALPGLALGIAGTWLDSRGLLLAGVALFLPALAWSIGAHLSAALRRRS